MEFYRKTDSLWQSDYTQGKVIYTRTSKHAYTTTYSVPHEIPKCI